MRPLVVVGDCLLDTDLDGMSERLAPDAPVPVIDVHRSIDRPGGAGLAALLAARSGVPVVFVTALAADAAGRRVRELLEHELDVVPLRLDGGTVRKSRLRVDGKAVARLDSGTGLAVGPLPATARAALCAAGAVLVSDYGRGVTELPEIRSELVDAARRVPVAWDPHPKGAPPTPGVRLATPNEMEVRAWTGHTGPLLPAISGLLAAWGCDALAVTCGSRGALLARALDSYQEFPAVPREGRDVCGAGDQFAAAAAAALLNGADVATASAAAVAAASRFVADGGAGAFTVPTRDVPTRDVPTRAAPPAAREAVELAAAVRERGGRVVATGGCFDLLHPGHLSLLRRARAAGDALLICLNSDASVRRLKGPGRPIANQDDRVRMLEALDPVDAVVIFDEDTPARILAELRPDVWVKGGDYMEPGLPEAAVVREYGGDVLLLPLVDGYSTSRLVAAAQGGY